MIGNYDKTAKISHVITWSSTAVSWSLSSRSPFWSGTRRWSGSRCTSAAWRPATFWPPRCSSDASLRTSGHTTAARRRCWSSCWALTGASFQSFVGVPGCLCTVAGTTRSPTACRWPLSRPRPRRPGLCCPRPTSVASSLWKRAGGGRRRGDGDVADRGESCG